MSSLHHVYHLYADGEWRKPWGEHCIALSQGLGDALTSFNVGIVGTPDSRAAATEVVTSFGATVVAEADSGWEQVSLNWLHANPFSIDDLVLYCHAKGSAHPGDVQAPWRRTMTFDLVINWSTALERFTSGDIDAVGSWWHKPGPEIGEFGYFAGNFWWATAKFLKTLNSPIMEHRFGAEAWLGTNDQIRWSAIRSTSFQGMNEKFAPENWVTCAAKEQNT